MASIYQIIASTFRRSTCHKVPINARLSMPTENEFWWILNRHTSKNDQALRTKGNIQGQSNIIFTFQTRNPSPSLPQVMEHFEHKLTSARSLNNQIHAKIFLHQILWNQTNQSSLPDGPGGVRLNFNLDSQSNINQQLSYTESYFTHFSSRKQTEAYLIKLNWIIRNVLRRHTQAYVRWEWTPTGNWIGPPLS